MISDPLTVITIVPLVVSLALLILPKISGSAEGLARASRAISMSLSSNASHHNHDLLWRN